MKISDVLVVALFPFFQMLSGTEISKDATEPPKEAEVYIAMTIDQIANSSQKDLVEYITESIPWHLEYQCNLTVSFKGKTMLDGDLKEAKVLIADTCDNVEGLAKTVLDLAHSYK